MRYVKSGTLLGASALILAVSAGYAVQTPASAASKTTAPAAISAKDKASGAKAHEEILAEFGGAYQSPQTPYVVSVGKNIAVQSGMSNARDDFTVTLLNSPVNNAFAIPGGYIYITRQLTALCNDEAEMAGVLGHEVEHVRAKHGKKRQSAATKGAIAGILGQVVGGLLGDNGGLVGALGGLLSEHSGTVAQLFTLKYSRKQEEEADDGGIRYLSKAGYDPMALSSMLNSLAMQTTLDARASGQDATAMPEWASTHPDPAKRVVRAQKGAAKYATGGVRNRDAFLKAIDGLMYGDDPEQGVVEGRQFLFKPSLLKFTIPTGFTMQNGGNAVSISGNGGQAQFGGGKTTATVEAHLDAVFKGVVGENSTTRRSATQTGSVNGITTYTTGARVATQSSGQVDVMIVAYQWANGERYHFVTMAPAGTNPFASMLQSLSRMTNAEAAAIKTRKVKVVTVKSGQSVASLSGQMAYDSLQTERFLTLNGLSSGASLTAGQKVKIVTY